MDLFSSATFGDLVLSNRVTMAPLTRVRASEGDVPGDLPVEHYGQRATLGLIVTEGTWPTQEGKAYTGQPGIVTDEQVAGWKRVADEVHAKGGTIVMQVMHGGRVSHPEVTGTDRIVGPSAVAIDGVVRTPEQARLVPHALTVDEVQQVVADIVTASARRPRGRPRRRRDPQRQRLPAARVPVARVERPHRRLRRQPANRARLGIETATAVAAAIGAGRVGIRISPMHNIQDVVETDLDDVTSYDALVDGLAPSAWRTSACCTPTRGAARPASASPLRRQRHPEQRVRHGHRPGRGS
nr:hypothetical protein GCM10025699_76810 [Microbacterium flavescens]